MKAIVQDTYGSPDVLELRGIDRPEIGPLPCERVNGDCLGKRSAQLGHSGTEKIGFTVGQPQAKHLRMPASDDGRFPLGPLPVVFRRHDR